ncbi:hypothetical protein Taro_007372, partial [Colocasia esculenta]|nr:hypothetical protein [Colocasia esculenta]
RISNYSSNVSTRLHPYSQESLNPPHLSPLLWSAVPCSSRAEVDWRSMAGGKRKRRDSGEDGDDAAYATPAAAASAEEQGVRSAGKKQAVLPSMIKNKAKRTEVHANLKREKKLEKRRRAKAREAATKRALELGEEPPEKKVPHTIENTRELDETVCKPDDEELNEMAPTLKRRNRKHLQPEEEGSEDDEVTSSEEEEEEEEEEEVLSEDESEEADSEHDMKEDGDSDDVEGTDDEDVNEAEGIGGPRQNASRGGEELEELEKEYQSLQQQEQSLLSNLKHQRDEDRIKGQAIKNQKALWNKNLEFRFLLQKAFSKSNRLPQEPLRFKFHDHDKTVENAYSELILSSEKMLNSMLQLQEALLEKNTSISQDNYVASNKLEVGNHDKWFQIQSMQCRIAPFRNSSIDKWQRKTQVTSGAAAIKSKLHAFNQNISDQVAAYMRDPSRMIGRMQSKRSAVGILGESPEEIVTESKEDGNVELANINGDPELIDDSEFYQQLLKEFFESFDVASEPAYSALRKSQTRKRNTVDRRASKSRKIR